MQLACRSTLKPQGDEAEKRKASRGQISLSSEQWQRWEVWIPGECDNGAIWPLTCGGEYECAARQGSVPQCEGQIFSSAKSKAQSQKIRAGQESC